jgi:hypothetical protein
MSINARGPVGRTLLPQAKLGHELATDLRAKADSYMRARERANESRPSTEARADILANTELLKLMDTADWSAEELSRYAKQMTGARLADLVLAIRLKGLQDLTKYARAHVEQLEAFKASAMDEFELINDLIDWSKKSADARREVARKGADANIAAKEIRKAEACAIYAKQNPETGKPWETKEECITYLMSTHTHKDERGKTVSDYGWSRAAINGYLPKSGAHSRRRNAPRRKGERTGA